MVGKNEWKIGQTSLYFESAGAGPGTVSQGQGDLGGMSYGTYQIASGTGTLNEFLAYSGYERDFSKLTMNSAEFVAEWKRLAASDPAFSDAQHDFIQKTHYDPQVQSLKRAGIDVDGRGAAVQDMVWSTAVQYRGYTTKIVSRGLAEAYGPDFKLGELSDVQIVRAVQDSKLKHVTDDFRSSLTQTPGLEARIETEKHALSYLAETGFPMATSEIGSQQRSFAPLKLGASGPRVEAIQEGLRDLGYLSAAGRSIDPDGHMGPATQEALRSFQRASGLYVHGSVSVLTERRLTEQQLSRDIGLGSLAEASTRMPSCSLDDKAHPDHGMFSSARMLVHDLDRQHGREPDARSDNLAASLVVAARSSGLERIDQVALSDDASRLWGVQRPPGVRDHFFDRQASTDTMQGLTTPISDSSSRWPEAMRSYEAATSPRLQ
ncbi:XVIPCD domain-containing protein [Luteibacter sp.]|uniref:VgrG-related protein n=1 Tax=Luteibacter sp. TaxID=1886636 RepID=UPI003F8186D4